MKRYSWMMIAMVLTIASLVSAAAYNTATITNASDFTVKTTSDSKLALIPKPTTAAGNKDGTAAISNGELRFSFGSMQPNSVYTWVDLFTVKNNSQETINVSIQTGMNYVAFSTDGTNFTNGAITANNVAPDGTVSVSVRISIPTGVGVPITASGTVVVSAVAQ